MFLFCKRSYDNSYRLFDLDEEGINVNEPKYVKRRLVQSTIVVKTDCDSRLLNWPTLRIAIGLIADK